MFFVLGLFLNMLLVNCCGKIRVVLRRAYESVVLKRIFNSIGL